MSIAISIFMCTMLLFFSFLWVCRSARFVKRKEDIISGIWKCQVCTHTYWDSSKEMSKCPVCKSYNKKTSYKE